MNDVAKLIISRAAINKISINTLCREAGVSRSWFEKLKIKIPKSLDAFIKIMEFLDNIEENKDVKVS